MKFRDRDAPVSPEGIIFRVFGYDHPKDSAFCDVEYAPESIYQSTEKRAVRDGGSEKYYKFYFDGGLKYVRNKYPQYVLSHTFLGDAVGIRSDQLREVRRPDESLRKIFNNDLHDPLLDTMREILEHVFEISKLKLDNFGVFGSIMHQFYNVRYSDIDLIIYGQNELQELYHVLGVLYDDPQTSFHNEFEKWTINDPPEHWNFKRYSKEEYGWYQKRKHIYSVYDSKLLGRTVKIEWEPVRKWSEIHNEYPDIVSTKKVGWSGIEFRVINDRGNGFMPTIYGIEVLDVKEGVKIYEIERIVNFVEEYRMQMRKDEIGYAYGMIEHVFTKTRDYYQLVLTYDDNYFDQVLKLKDRS